MRLYETLARFSAIIQSYEVLQYEVAGLSSRLKLSIVLRNGTELHVREMILDGLKRKYAFHWQDATGQLRMRWDNATHWPDIDTYPHHKHIGDTGVVVASDATALEEVLAVIHLALEQG